MRTMTMMIARILHRTASPPTTRVSPRIVVPFVIPGDVLLFPTVVDVVEEDVTRVEVDAVVEDGIIGRMHRSKEHATAVEWPTTIPTLAISL